VERIRSIADQYYPDSAHLVGESASIYDMKSTITADSVKVNLISAGAIGLILLITFRSFSLPFLLLLTIESSIFINVSIPYFTGQTLNYIGFLIISSIQLGATVDYAILFASRYLENRGSLDKKEAALKTVSDTVVSIFTSGGILATGGLLLSAVSTNGMIAELGILIARGAALSALLVLFFLPALLTLLDGLIQKTTLGLRFYHISSSQKEVRTP
jgi:predicted RND superfamily exporter protein